jgi:succinoglycan biosynthesis protein ExoH
MTSPAPSSPARQAGLSAPLLHGLPPQTVSQAIDLARILLVVGLVFLHYGTFPGLAAEPRTGFDPRHFPLATWVNSAVLFVFMTSVPLLSLISGWLFFALPAVGSWPVLFRRLRRRWVTLYLPLVTWNSIVLMTVIAAVYFMPKNPAWQSFNLNPATATPWQLINGIFSVTESPIAFQFWFVRDLFVACLCSPLLWGMLRTAPALGAFLLGVVWITQTDLVIFLRPDIPFFFFLGGLMRQKRWRLTLSRSLTAGLVTAMLLLCSVRALAPLWVYPSDPDVQQWLSPLTTAMRGIGVVAWWGLIYRLATTAVGQALGRAAGFAFFLHAAHWPLLALIKQLLWVQLPRQSENWLLVHYSVSVAVTVVLSVAVGVLMARVTPRLFAVLNGGRLPLRASDRQHQPAALVPTAAVAAP